MNPDFAAAETWIRLGAFVGVFVCMAVWEWRAPRRKPALARRARWPANIGIVALPQRLDRVLRRIVVTPDMHRVHHSVHSHETNANFGFNLPWWDHWFSTYRAQPQDGHQAMRIGLPHFREPRWRRLDRMLVQPWVKPGSDEI